MIKYILTLALTLALTLTLTPTASLAAAEGILQVKREYARQFETIVAQRLKDELGRSWYKRVDMLTITLGSQVLIKLTAPDSDHEASAVIMLVMAEHGGTVE